jgi:hypothetical protein
MEVRPVIDAERLEKLFLMLSSDHPGEVVAAAQAIGRALKADGSDWHVLASRLKNPDKPKSRKAARDAPPDDWHVMHEFCLDRDHRRDHRLRPREREFIDSIGNWRGDLTEKQYAWLVAIYQRLGGSK